MKQVLKQNWRLILIVFITLVLGAIAIITAYRLYQMRREPVAPTAPAPAPAAEEACTMYFSVSTPTPAVAGCYETCSGFSPCEEGLVCGTDWCPPGEICLQVLKCYNPDCPYEETCVCGPTPTATATPTGTATPTPTTAPTATPTPTSPVVASPTPTSAFVVTPTPTSIAVATPTPVVELPEAGFTLPTIGIAAGGLLLFALSLLLLL